MNRFIVAGALAALSASACTTLTAPDEAKSLQEATGDLTGALKTADGEQSDALLAYKTENFGLDLARGVPVKLVTDCSTKVDAINGRFEDLLDLPYSSVAADNTYRELRGVAPCGIPGLTLDLPALPAPEAVDLKDAPVSTLGQTSLSKAARQLDAYTEALADIATGESSGKVDAAQAKVVAAGKGLLGALKVGGPADAILDLANQAISSLVAAKRNRTTRDFLDKMDPAVPFMMERLGQGARLAVLEAALNRSRAASDLADYGNATLNRTGMVVWRGGKKVASAERLAAWDSLSARLSAQNEAFLRLRRADPMTAARGFAEAHHALREIYHDPRANRAAIAEGIAAFAESAAALRDALKPAAKD